MSSLIFLYIIENYLFFTEQNYKYTNDIKIIC